LARVLVIEDNADVRSVIIRMLRSAGYDTLEAANGIAGMDAVLEETLDLVITDLLMPDQEGIETIKRIREIAPGIPIIAISGGGSEEFSPLHDARLMGADLAIEKPFSVDDLLGGVAQLLARGRG
jgi:DNA-binding response OmpR family regulator